MFEKLLYHMDFNQNEIRNAVAQNLATPPSSPSEGQFFFNTTSGYLEYWDGSNWIPAATVVSFGAVTAQTSYGQASSNGVATTFARSDHTHGTPAHGNTEHASINISALAAPTADVAWGSNKITGLADPTNAQDAATKNYVDTEIGGLGLSDLDAPTGDLDIDSNRLVNVADPVNAQDAATKAYVDGMAQGLDFKASVRVASTGNINLSSPGATIDGVTMASGDRFLAKDQSTGAQKGIYVWNGAAVAATRAPDADAAGEISGGTLVFVEEGSAHAGQQWVQTEPGDIDVGTDDQTWAQFGGGTTYSAGDGLTLSGSTFDVGAGTGITVNANDVAVDTSVVPRKYQALIGNGSNTTITVTHNLNNSDAMIVVREVATGERVFCGMETTSANAVELHFSVAPASNALSVTVMG